jgi:nitroreductase
MDVFEAITRRRSYRGAFLDRPVDREQLRRIVAAGLDAPSGCNAQTTSFVIVDDPDMVLRIGRLHKMEAMRTARAFIACVVDEKPPAVYGHTHFQVEDCAAAVENMLLAVTALGYATVWVDGWLRRNDHAGTIGGWLGLPPGKFVRVILPVGVPAGEQAAPPKRSFGERAWFAQYGQDQQG